MLPQICEHLHFNWDKLNLFFEGMKCFMVRIRIHVIEGWLKMVALFMFKIGDNFQKLTE